MTMTCKASAIRVKPPLWAKQLLLAASIIACSTANAAIELENWWVRALPPSQTMTAAYGSVTNTGNTTVTLSGATTAMAKHVELHTTQHIGDQMRMVPMAFPSLAPGESWVLAPGGPHLMLMGVDRMPKSGSTVNLCIQLAANESVCVNADVMRSAPKVHSNHNMHH